MGTLVAMGLAAGATLVVVSLLAVRGARSTERSVRALLGWRVVPPTIVLLVIVGPVLWLVLTTDDSGTNPLAATFGVLFMLFGLVPVVLVPALVGLIAGTLAGLALRRRVA